MRSRRNSPPFPLATESCSLFSLARHALWHGLAALGLSAGDRVLVPAYHHGSEVETLRRRGLEVCFYEGDERLAPDAGELERLLDGQPAAALHLIHYLGFPQDTARWRSWCDERGVMLLEDAAQAWLADDGGVSLGSLGDLAIFSLYKTFGLPDGAALACRDRVGGGSDARRERGLGGALGRHRMWVAQRAPFHRRARAEQPYDPQADFDLGDPRSAPARTTAALLPRIADRSAASIRRSHYRYLLDQLSALVPPPFDLLPPGASPWVMPIETSDKAALRERLAGAGIGALDLWSVAHPSLDAERFPAVARRRARTLGLPVHQELRQRDLERIATAVRAAS